MFDLSFPVIISSFFLIFLVELPDKTALAVIALAGKYKARFVLFGVFLAFLIQTIVGVTAGRLLLLLPAKPIHIAAGLGFIIFAIFTLHSNEVAELKHEEEIVEKQMHKHHRAWITSFIVLFLAEWGDLSQLSTAALVARTNNPLSVGIGAMLALCAVSILAIFIGQKISLYVTQSTLQKISGYLFLFVGVIIVLLTLYPLPGVHF